MIENAVAGADERAWLDSRLLAERLAVERIHSPLTLVEALTLRGRARVRYQLSTISYQLSVVS